MTSPKLRDTGLTCSNAYTEELFEQNQTKNLEILLDEKTQNVSKFLSDLKQTLCKPQQVLCMPILVHNLHCWIILVRVDQLDIRVRDHIYRTSDPYAVLLVRVLSGTFLLIYVL